MLDALVLSLFQCPAPSSVTRDAAPAPGVQLKKFTYLNTDTGTVFFLEGGSCGSFRRLDLTEESGLPFAVGLTSASCPIKARASCLKLLLLQSLGQTHPANGSHRLPTVKLQATTKRSFFRRGCSAGCFITVRNVTSMVCAFICLLPQWQWQPWVPDSGQGRCHV